MSDVAILERQVRSAFSKGSIQIRDLARRQFPGELIFVVEVSDSDYEHALRIASALDLSDEQALITVRRSKVERPSAKGRVSSLSDSRVTRLIELINSRSRVSKVQPSLQYVTDVDANLSLCLTPRHHLIFGRRGVGKTALMAEAKRVAESRGDAAFWINVQTLSGLDASTAFCTTALRLLELPEEILAGRVSAAPGSVSKSQPLRRKLEDALSRSDTKNIRSLIPDIQTTIAQFCTEMQGDLFVFLDDIHYLSMVELPTYLDMVHAITRDTNAWIKAAGIRHQTRWFTDNPPVGLQTGQDANIITLDVTLEEPEKAKAFLQKILSHYVDEAGIGSMVGFMPQPTIDRLVLASGGVPRDFLVLAADATQVAKQRTNARAVGIQDVNEAAGQLAKVKLQELEQDAASSVGRAEARLSVISILDSFLFTEKQTSYFRVDFRDKEQHTEEYDLLQSLMDLRMLHLIHGSLSDSHHAGKRSEVYMSDLSRFSGSRLKHKLKVLDFSKDHLVLKKTGTTDAVRVGDTPKKLLAILRNGPEFQLSALSKVVSREKKLRKRSA